MTRELFLWATDPYGAGSSSVAGMANSGTDKTYSFVYIDGKSSFRGLGIRADPAARDDGLELMRDLIHDVLDDLRPENVSSSPPAGYRSKTGRDRPLTEKEMTALRHIRVVINFSECQFTD